MSKSVNLARVAMPLVELIGSEGISWADREKCADALRTTIRHFQSMENERIGQILGAAIGQQQGIRGQSQESMK